MPLIPVEVHLAAPFLLTNDGGNGEKMQDKHQLVEMGCGAKIGVWGHKREQDSYARRPPRLLIDLSAGIGMSVSVGFCSPEEARILARTLEEMADFAEAVE